MSNMRPTLGEATRKVWARIKLLFGDPSGYTVHNNEGQCDWNRFVHLLASKPYGELVPAQRPAHLVFWYESEVQNGGHLQYFANRGVERAAETIQALDKLGAKQFSSLLGEALDRQNSMQRSQIESVEEFCCEAQRGEFEDLDAAFCQASPTLADFLERELEANRGRYLGD